MGKNLLIVESPSKAKTLKKYLGKDFEVLASYGHVRDLVPKSGAVDTEHDFAMKYQLVARNKKHIDAIVKTALTSDKIYLATDPDRLSGRHPLVSGWPRRHGICRTDQTAHLRRADGAYPATSDGLVIKSG